MRQKLQLTMVILLILGLTVFAKWLTQSHANAYQGCT